MSKLIRRKITAIPCRANKDLMNELRLKDRNNEPVYIQDIFNLKDTLHFKEYDYNKNRYVSNGEDLLMIVAEVVKRDNKGTAVLLKELTSFKDYKN